MTKSSNTRMLILEKSFQLIYVQGYQSTSIDDIIATTKVTKGAFFYHFKNKETMGLALINELMAPAMNEHFATLLKKEKDPLNGIYNLMKNLLLGSPELLVEYGCPAGNLSQEMAPLNKDFSKALKKLVTQWQDLLTVQLKQGKKTGLVKKGINEQQVVSFVMSGYWGIRNLGKLEATKKPYQIYLKELKRYLNTLR